MKKIGESSVYDGDIPVDKLSIKHQEEGLLFQAARQSDMATINRLSTIYNINEQRLCDGFTPLMCAVSHNRLSAVSALIENGADPNISTKTGTTAISIALKSADFRPEIIQHLLKHGAKINAGDVTYYNAHYSKKHGYDVDIISYQEYKNNISGDKLTNNDISSVPDLGFLSEEEYQLCCDYMIDNFSLSKEKSKFYSLQGSGKSYQNIPSKILYIDSSDSSSDEEFLNESLSSVSWSPDSSEEDLKINEAKTKPYEALLKALDKNSCISMSPDLFCFNYSLDPEVVEELIEILPMFGFETTDHSIGYIFCKDIDSQGEGILKAGVIVLYEDVKFSSIRIGDLINYGKTLHDFSSYNNTLCDTDDMQFLGEESCDYGFCKL